MFSCSSKAMKSLYGNAILFAQCGKPFMVDDEGVPCNMSQIVSIYPVIYTIYGWLYAIKRTIPPLRWVIVGQPQMLN